MPILPSDRQYYLRGTYNPTVSLIAMATFCHTKMDRCTTYPACSGLQVAKLCSENVFITITHFVVRLSQCMYILQMHLCRYSDVMMKCVQRPGSLEHSLLYIREAVLCGYGTTLCWHLACKDLLMLVCSLNCHSGHTKQKIIIVLVACMVLMKMLGHVANFTAVPAQGVYVV